MAADSPLDGWIKTWIEGQKAALDQWSAGQHAQDKPAGFGSFADLFSAAAGQSSGAHGPGGQMAALWGLLGSSVQDLGRMPWDLPEVGPLREQQAALRELGEALADYQRLALEVAGVLAKVHADTLDLLARRALEQANGGKPLDSVKALHDLWVECGETTYAKVVHGESYCRLQAALCNAGIRVQVQRQQQMERWLKLADLPTRSELNTLNRRVQELKRLVEAGSAARAAPASPAPKPRTARKSRRKA